MKRTRLFFLLVALLGFWQGVFAQENTPEAYAVLDANGLLKFYYDTSKPDGAYDIPLEEYPGWVIWDDEEVGNTEIKSVEFDTSFSDYYLESAYCMFATCTALESIDFTNFNTSAVTNMCCMFYGCSSLTELDLSNFITENVEDMSWMFYGCSGLTNLNLSNFITANVYDMCDMFYGCSSLSNLDLSNFDTSNVGDMSYMFAGCSNLHTLDVSNFNTANVEDMSGMFGMCSNLQTLNVSNFNTANVYGMSYMFYGCSNLTTIYCNDDWNRENNQQYSYEMFSGCSQLKGAIQYSDDFTNDVTFANPDNGYFTASGPRPYAVLTNGKLTFYYDELKSTRNGDIYNVPWNSGNQNDRGEPGWAEWDNDGNTSITSVAFDESFSNYNLQSAYCMFASCTALESIDFTNFNTSEVTNMWCMFYKCSSLESLNLSNFNTSAVTNMQSMFEGCTNLRALNLTSFNTENVVNMRSMFLECSKLETIYCNDDWSETSVNLEPESSGYMFYTCYKLPNYAHNCWDVTYAKPSTDGGYFTATTVRPYAVLTDNGTLTFYYDDNVDKIMDSHTNYVYYNFDWGNSNPDWYDNKSLIKTVTFDASFGEYQIASTGAMFYKLYNLTKVNGLENLNTSNVQYMWDMFRECYSLKTLDLTSFNTANVIDMESMFYGCSNLETIYCNDDWSVGRLEGFNSDDMFYDCINLPNYNPENLDVTYAKPSSKGGYFTKRDAYCTVSDGTLTFYYDENKPASGSYEFTATGEGSWRYASFTAVTFDASMLNYKFTSTAGMFSGKTSLTVINDLSNLNTSKVTDMSNMFNGCSALDTIYCNYDWSGLDVTSDNMFLGCTSLQGYNASNVSAAYAKPIANGGYFTTYGIPYAVYEEGTLTFYNDGNKGNREGTVYDLPWEDEYPEWSPNSGGSGELNAPERKDAKADYVYITSVVFDESFGYYHGLTSTKNMFAGLYGVTSITGLNYLNTENVTNMSGMFAGCSNLSSLNLSSFDTGEVTDMSGMFSSCSALTSLDLSNFNTEKVTNMTYMFFGCYDLESLNLSSFDTGEVTDMSTMFFSCNSLTSLDLSNFDTGKVTTMETMFNNCYNLTSLNISSFNTEKVTNMSSMFNTCRSLTSLDLSNFDTEKVTTMYSMFEDCSQLQSLNLSGWTNTNVTTMEYMFQDCSALRDLNLTNFQTVKVIDMGSMFYGCSALTSLDLTGFKVPADDYVWMSNMFCNCTNLRTIFCNKDFNNGHVSGSSMFSACVNLQGARHHSTYDTDYTYANPSTGYFTYGLRDYADNSSLIANTASMPQVGLVGRTLYKTGIWNTLCLPFNVGDANNGLVGTLLEGATVMRLDNSAESGTGFDAGTGALTINFADAAYIEAGVPYIIKWENTSDPNLVNPIFTNVTTSSSLQPVEATCVSFMGNYDPKPLTSADNDIIYLGANNKLYFPNRDMSIGAFRAYFQLSGIDANQIKAFNLNFGEETGIEEISYPSNSSNSLNSFFTLDGHRLLDKPTQKGIYINAGRKVMIK